jgi:hypothetical protein
MAFSRGTLLNTGRTPLPKAIASGVPITRSTYHRLSKAIKEKSLRFTQKAFSRIRHWLLTAATRDFLFAIFDSLSQIEIADCGWKMARRNEGGFFTWEMWKP